MDADIFVSGKKKLRIQTYPDACGRGLRQISGLVLLMFLLMLALMSRVFSLVMLMLCFCTSENQPLHMMVWKAIFSIEDQVVLLSKFS